MFRVAVLLAAAVLASSARAQIRVYRADDPSYLSLPPAPVRTVPAATSRMVVLRDGVPVLDRGLHDEDNVRTEKDAEGRWMVEEGFRERVNLDPGGDAAVVVGTRFKGRQAARAEESEDLLGNPELQGRSTITLVDTAHPDGRWTIELEPNRWVRRATVLPAHRGVAFSTYEADRSQADLRIVGLDGREHLNLTDDRVWVSDFEVTGSGGFLAVDVAYPPGMAAADRGVLVVDLLHWTHWSYDWRYGGENEPLSWDLSDTGVLEVRLPGRVRRFDRFGGPLRARRR